MSETSTDAQKKTAPPTTGKTPPSTGRRVLIWTAAIAGAVALYALIGFVVLPKIATSMLPEKLAEVTGRKAEVGDIRFNPFKLILEVEGLRLMEADGENAFVSLGLLHADVDGTAVFRLAAGLEELRLVRPDVNVAMVGKGRFNFSDILDKQAQAAANGEASEHTDAGAALFPLLGSNFIVEDARVRFEDRTKGVTHLLEDLDLSVPFISTLPGDSRVWVQPALSAKLNGQPLELEGRTRPFEDTLRTEFNLILDALDLTTYRPYIPVDKRATLDGGTLSCDLSLAFTQGDTPNISLMGPVRVAGLDVRLDGKPLVGFDALLVQVGGVDLDKKLATLDLVQLVNPSMAVTLDKDGKPDFMPLIPASKASTGTPPVKDNDDVEGEGEDDAAAEDTEADEQPAFGVIVQQFALKNGTVAFKDNARDFATRITQLAATVDGLDTRGGDAAYAVSFGLNGTPLLKLNGAFDMIAQNASGDLALSGLDATTFAPYYADALPVVLDACTVGTTVHFDAANGDTLKATLNNLGVTLSDVALRPKDSKAAGARINAVALAGGDIDPMARSGSVGSLTVSGIRLHPQGDDAHFALLQTLGVKTIAFDASENQPPAATVGSVSLDGLVVHPMGDTTPAIELDSLGVKAINFKAAEEGGTPALAIGSVAIKAPKALAVLDENGIPNIARIIATATGEPQPQPKTKEEKEAELAEAEAAAEQSTADATSDAPDENDLTPHPPAILVTVDSLTLADAEAAFRDESVTPPYATALRGLSGGVQNFSNAPGAPPANLNLSGMVDGHAPLTIEAVASPTDLGLNPKLRLLLSDMDLTAVSPYTAKYTSYTLAKGQLSLNLAADVTGRDLRGDNVIAIKNIELGSYEKSPDDVGIPMPLALALLTDRSGSVKLDVPVHGNLDNPDFRLGKVIFGAVMNIIFKAVTSPFALIGGLFGGGEDLDSLPMAAGATTLTPALESKLDTVAKALTERPRLSVEVSGTASPGPDGQALTDLNLRRAIATPRFLELQEQGKAPESPEFVALSPAEYPALVREAYEAAPFDKPENVKDLPEEQQTAAMENLLRQHLTATADEIAELAKHRALTVKDALISRGIEPGRIFLKEPDAKRTEDTPAGVVLTLR